MKSCVVLRGGGGYAFFPILSSSGFKPDYRFLRFLLLWLLSGTLLQPVLAQQEIYECPDPVEYGFTGIPEKTLCEQYFNLSCQIQIGAGTPFDPRAYGSEIYTKPIHLRRSFERYSR
ncbi:MAG TPA: hypothetical protein PKE06_00015 [Flavilitoribacter sp.]|nr:hypothetical protein [Flavilitoribacter sp.]HMQ88987.1 hypothetical protein [Flavilitoribacter sp.]